ncbi:signal peptidase II [Nocardioides panacisoli]|uniref:Lipoprotein signal peptidase n=1 Tax=Nocardioides panacisoli TaxID=627624 RepID=A0ABP7I8N2_9ACTN
MQAARGTSVETPDSGESRPFLARRGTWLLFAAVAVVAYAADQVAKRLAVTHLHARDDVQVVGDLLQLRLTHNPGAAFSLGTDFTVALAFLAMVASLVLLWFSRGLRDRVWAVGLGLILAGIDGNLTDRMIRDPGPFRGEVVDFLMLPHWPIFNVADMCINVGALLVLVQIFRGIRLDGSRAVSSPSSDEDDS